MLEKTLRITNARNAKTLSPSHMKQCIMSESRFDFLRELVKDVPDINIAEEQLAADNDPDEPLSASPPPPLPPPQLPSSILNSNEPINLSISNGSHSNRLTGHNTKRTADPEYAVASDRSWKFNKQHSLDSVADKLSISQNFYNANSHGSSSNSSGSGTSTTNEPIINYSIKFPKTKLDISRPSRLQRVESTPNPLIPVATTTLSANKQPIINFDFTKVPLASTSLMSDVCASLSLPSPTIVINSSHIKQTPPKTPIPDLLKIGTSGVNMVPTKPITPSNHSVEHLLQQPMRKTSTTIEVNSIEFSTSFSHLRNNSKRSKIIWILCFQPMSTHSRTTQPKYHHSHAQQQTKHLPSSTSSSKPNYSAISASAVPSASSTLSTTKNMAHHQTPVININFNNSSATPMISYTIPSTTISNSTSLEMDEDYDNI